MNVEELRDFCLSLSDEVEEKFPFGKFRTAKDVLVFYICGHMFCYFDINDISNVTVKCQPERIGELKEQYAFIDKPFNGNSKYWIGVDATIADDDIIKRLIRSSFDIVRLKGKKKLI